MTRRRPAFELRVMVALGAHRIHRLPLKRCVFNRAALNAMRQVARSVPDSVAAALRVRLRAPAGRTPDVHLRAMLREAASRQLPPRPPQGPGAGTRP